jgi:hypothetical protein
MDRRVCCVSFWARGGFHDYGPAFPFDASRRTALQSGRRKRSGNVTYFLGFPAATPDGHRSHAPRTDGRVEFDRDVFVFVEEAGIVHLQRDRADFSGGGIFEIEEFDASRSSQ